MICSLGRWRRTLNDNKCSFHPHPHYQCFLLFKVLHNFKTTTQNRLFYFPKCQLHAKFTSARSPVALCIINRTNESECQLGGAIAHLVALLQTALLSCGCGFRPWPPCALWLHSDSFSPPSRDRTAGPLSLRLNRRKTIRFWSVMLLLAVIGLELTGFTLVRQRGNFITFKTFCFPTSSVTADT